MADWTEVVQSSIGVEENLETLTAQLTTRLATESGVGLRYWDQPAVGQTAAF